MSAFILILILFIHLFSGVEGLQKIESMHICLIVFVHNIVLNIIAF